MFLFKFKTIMMVFLLQYADNKWKKRCHDVCILNRKKVIYITHLYILPCKYVSLYEGVCFITVSCLLHWTFYASNIQWICCCECVTFFCLCSFLKQKSDKCYGSVTKLWCMSVKIPCTRHPIFLQVYSVFMVFWKQGYTMHKSTFRKKFGINGT